METTLANVYIETENNAFHIEGVEIPAEASYEDDEHPYDWLRLVSDELDRLSMEGKPWELVLFYNEDGLSVSHTMRKSNFGRL